MTEKLMVAEISERFQEIPMSGKFLGGDESGIKFLEPIMLYRFVSRSDRFDTQQMDILIRFTHSSWQVTEELKTKAKELLESKLSEAVLEIAQELADYAFGTLRRSKLTKREVLKLIEQEFANNVTA